MTKAIRKLGAFLTVLFVTVMPLQKDAHAKTRVTKVFITGPGIPQPVEMTDRVLVNSWASFIGLQPDQPVVRPQTPLTSPPAVTGTGYVLTRYMSEHGSEFRVVDRLRFFLSAPDGHSYTFYIGVDARTIKSAYNGKWFMPTSDAAARMQLLLKRIGVKK